MKGAKTAAQEFVDWSDFTKHIFVSAASRTTPLEILVADHYMLCASNVIVAAMVSFSICKERTWPLHRGVNERTFKGLTLMLFGVTEIMEWAGKFFGCRQQKMRRLSCHDPEVAITPWKLLQSVQSVKRAVGIVVYKRCGSSARPNVC